MGIIETSSGELDIIRDEILKMHDLTDKPFGVNIAQAFVRDPKIIDFIIAQGVKFVTTSAGDPMKYTALLKEANLTVYHVVPSLKGALRAIEAGVDGLIVEGGEGGGFKNPNDVASMVLIPQVCEAVDVPVVAAGGMTDGRSMAAAFALGAEGILMGTRILSAAESPVHSNWKEAIIDADSTDTVFLNRSGPGPALRALRTERTTRLQKDGVENIFGEFAGTQDVYFGGNLEAGIALTGQVAGRITEVKPVKQIFDETLKEFGEVTGRLAALSGGS
jgi:enoyl-[acyl-carrier protein] reductase II